MPTVLRVRGYRIYFHSHELDEPPHARGLRWRFGEVLAAKNVAVARNLGYSALELGEIHRLVREHRDALLEPWHGYFRTGR
jgi:hypothetical protein